jgi:TATA-box binding protein (TBP) (component of TFIID and TFIIIB)
MESQNTDRKTGAELVFPTFEENKVSTKTIIAVTNLSLNIHKVFETLPITDYIVISKRRGRKKKTVVLDPNKHIPSGSIITLKFEDKIRGVDLKKKKKSKKQGKYFRNSVTIVMVIKQKKINFKLSRNGKFQMTGCKTDEQAEHCIKYFWKYIEKTEDVFTFNNKKSHFEVIFVPAMRNIDFSLGFLVDREKLSKYINVHTAYYSMLEASFGYTGVNIKVPMKDDITTLDLVKIEYLEDEKIYIEESVISDDDDSELDDIEEPVISDDDESEVDDIKEPVPCDKKNWVSSIIPYTDYLDLLTEKERDKKLNKTRYVTFLAFHSGKIIVSGITSCFMIETYYEFLNIIRDCYDIIEEKLITD